MSHIQEIKDKLDIIDIIGERISLQRSGKNFRGVCPFHSEKTPSFFVSPDMQSFICFGCHKKGDLFTFIQEYERLTFPEALELLADKAGVEIPKNTFDNHERERRDLFSILELTERYYHYLLTEHQLGEAGRDYLETRGTNKNIVRQFSLGYAPPGWDNLFVYLTQKKKIPAEMVEAAGLALKGRGGKYYDRFRHRLMFPLHDHRGRVVGFSGRVLDPTAKEAKYINSPETELYHKRLLLFGYWQNLDTIREKAAAIIVEGEFDVLSSVQAHVKNVVGVKGSALTIDQIRILSRTVKTLYLALDADSAGIEATKKAIELIQPFPVALRVIPLQGGKDPDEWARQEPKAWRAAINNSISAFDYVLDHTLKEHDIQTAQGQKTVSDIMLSLLLQIEHPVERSFYLKQLSEKLEVSENVLEEQWQLLQKKKAIGGSRSRKSEEDTQQAQEEAAATDDTQGAYTLQLLFSTPNPTAETIQSLKPQHFHLVGHQRIIQAYQDFMKKEKNFDLRHFSSTLAPELQEIATLLFVRDLPLQEEEISRELAISAAQLRQRYQKQRLTQISDDLAQLEKKLTTDPQAQEEYERLQREFLKISRGEDHEE